MLTNLKRIGRIPVPTPLIVLSLITLSSCQADKIQIPAQEVYNREFLKQFGIASGGESGWNTASRISAVISPELLAGAERIKVYTSMPGNPECTLVASYPASQRSFGFDLPTAANEVYVTVNDAAGRVTYGAYSRVTDGQVNVGGNTSRTGTKTPIPYPYLLNSNPSLGTFPISRPYNIDFWREMGYTIEYAPEPDNIDTKTIHTVNLPEGGFDCGQWGMYFFDKETPFGNVRSNNIKITIKYLPTHSGDDTHEHQIIVKAGYDENWNIGDLPGNREIYLPCAGAENTKERKASVTLDRADIEFLRDRHLCIHGNNAIITGVTWQELPWVEETLKDYTANFTDLFDLYGLAESPVHDFTSFKANYLKPNRTYDIEGYSSKDLVSLVGRKTGVFHEEIDFDTKECNMMSHMSELHPEEGVDYWLKSDGEVSLDFFFGSASYFNSFGYFYYTDEEYNLPEKERMKVLLRKPMFLLMYNASPGTNLEHQTTQDGPWQSYTMADCDVIRDRNDPNEGKDQGDGWKHCTMFSDFVENAEKGDYDNGFAPRMRSSNYRLVYYPEDQFVNGKLSPDARGTYTFPANTHIAFFIITSGQYILECEGETDKKINHRRIAFSRPIMNQYIGNTINFGHSHESGSPSKMNTGNGAPTAWAPFVTYTWHGQLMMGVEDYYAESEPGIEGGDHDMNDLLFRVNGDFVRNREEMSEDKPARQSWIIACEDLGGTYDFDFNDVVFGVSNVAGETTAEVTALASGGTRPVYLASDYPQVIDGQDVTYPDNYLIPRGNTHNGEFHSWWNNSGNTSRIINAKSWEGPGATVTIRVDENFSLASKNDHLRPSESDTNMGGFRVVVNGADGGITHITAPIDDESETAPQMFLVPNGWNWPREEQRITEVYNQFLAWRDYWWLEADGVMRGNVIKHGWRPIVTDAD